MTSAQTNRDDSNSTAIVGVLGMLGLSAAFIASGRRRTTARRARTDGVETLAAYLHDHLTGADAATAVVDRLRRRYAGQTEGALFESLYRRFLDERAVVEGILRALGMSRTSPKRFVGRAAGTAMRALLSSQVDDFSLFQALEGLAAGVQGKRCMWQALRELSPSLPATDSTQLELLEADAVRQWEAIERSRLTLAPRVFSIASSRARSSALVTNSSR